MYAEYNNHLEDYDFWDEKTTTRGETTLQAHPDPDTQKCRLMMMIIVVVIVLVVIVLGNKASILRRRLLIGQ